MLQHSKRFPHAALAALLSAVALALALPVPALANPVYQSVEELEGATIAYVNGSVYGLEVAKRVDGTEETYYASLADCVTAVETGKADAACGISYCCELAVNRSGGAVEMVPERVRDIEEAFFFKKGSPLTAQFNTVMDKLEEDGTLEALEAKWVSSSDDEKTLPEQDWPAPNGELAFATSGVLEPLSYPGPSGVPYGYDVELALLIAKELGYSLDIQMIAMDSIFAAVESGKVDFGGTLTVTPERAEMVDFSRSAIDVGIGLVVKSDGEAPAGGTPEFTTLDELSGKTFGVLTGTVLADYVNASIENPGEILGFNTIGDQVAALLSGKVDAIACDEPAAQRLISRNEGIAIAPEVLGTTDYGFFFPKGSEHVDEMNAVIERFWEDGTIDALREKWVLSSDETGLTMPEQDWPAPNGTLIFASAPSYEPMSYTGADNTIMGFDVELAYLIAKELGYRIQVTSYPFDSLIAAVQTGKADFGGTGVSITEERAQMVDFSTPIYNGAIVAIVRTVDDTGQAGFFENMAASFERTFIVENRWKMVLSGLGITALITVASAALGTALAFGLTFLRRGRAWADKLVGAFQTLMGGLPIVVVLMLLYYVVFGAIDISGVLVAILGFTLSFGASASANIWNSVKGVDKGQNEAALALGYKAEDSFRKAVLPQAAKQFLPLLLGQAVSLVKETSIVGYIAVQDLTRASDLIRARTMEAFFPLIATAVIYFIACWAVRRIGEALIKRYDPDARPRTIEGVRP